MALPNNINDREYRKFVENQSGDVAVRTKEEYASYTSSVNTTEITLGSGAVYTGTWELVEGFVSVLTACLSSSDGVLQMQFSNDGVGTYDSTLSYQVFANVNEVHRLTITRKYFRSVFTNSSTAQSSFQLITTIGNHTALSAPLNLALQQDADAVVVRTVSEEFDIANNKRSGISIVNKSGRNRDIDSASVPEDIWGGGSVYTGFPTTAAELITVVSTSVNDAAAGTGARIVTIEGLDESGNRQSENITLNGLTKVNYVNTYYRVHRSYVISSGASNTAFNDGAITVQHLTTVANIFSVMAIGVNYSSAAVYTVPLGYTGFLKHFDISCAKATSAIVEGAVWFRTYGKSPVMFHQFSASEIFTFTDTFYGGLVFTSLTDIAFRITSCSSNNVVVDATFDILIIKD